MSDREEFVRRLGAAIARHVGQPGDVSKLGRLTGGATKATWSFTSRVGKEELPFILQQSVPRGPKPGDEAGELPRIFGAEDAACMIAARAAGVPVPPVRAVLEESDGLDMGYVMDRIPGETIARRILREPDFDAARKGFASQCGEILGRLHTMDRKALPFLTDTGAARQVELWYRSYRGYKHPIPAVELGFRWARENLPKRERNTVVHGDFRMGNLIVGPDRINAVIDWEICHTGDPMEDLGWLCVRTWRFGGPKPVGGAGSREDLFAAYEKASGIAVDPAHVRFWETLGSVKWAVMCMGKGQQHLHGGPFDMEQLAIGRRTEEPLSDFLRLLDGED